MKFKALKSFFQCHVAKFRVQMREICLIESMHVKLRKVTRNNDLSQFSLSQNTLMILEESLRREKRRREGKVKDVNQDFLWIEGCFSKGWIPNRYVSSHSDG